MYKFLSSLLLVATLHAEMVDGIAMVVKGEPITLYDVKKEMKVSNIDAKRASEVLIRRALEKAEIEKRYISVSSSDVYADIRQSAARNNMSVNDFYKAIYNSNGLSSMDLQEKIKQKLLSQKLYKAISYSAMSEPTQTEIEEFYELHKDMFAHPSAFSVDVYKSQNKNRLQEKITNPMLYAPDIQTEKQTLPYNAIAPELAALLQNTPQGSFSKVVPDGQGFFLSFYVTKVHQEKNITLEKVKNQIINTIMAKKREAVLSDYFARLRQNADITILRTVH